MKSGYISKKGSSRLLIIFAGWGMDEKVFQKFSRPGYDIVAVWDYTDLDIDWTFTKDYEELCIFAWSMGVFAASKTIKEIEPKITLKIAVNGTKSPISDEEGIPKEIFYATLNNLSPLSVKKFFRRMSVSKEDRQLFEENKPEREFVDIQAELQALSSFISKTEKLQTSWDIAIIGEKDLIFPAKNQLAAWDKENTAIHIYDGGHYFNFLPILDKFFIDKDNVRAHFHKSLASYEENAPVQEKITERIAFLMKGTAGDIEKHVDLKVLEIGSGTGFLTRKLAEIIKDGEIEMWDFASDIPRDLPNHLKYTFKAVDAEVEIASSPAESYDYIFSANAIQWFNSPERFLYNASKTLKPGGYAFLSTFTKDNMKEITDITGNSLPFLDKEQWEKLVSRYFEIVKIEDSTIQISFPSPLDVVRHLKLTGVNSLGNNSGERKSPIRLLSEYPKESDGTCRLTYKPLIMMLKKKEGK